MSIIYKDNIKNVRMKIIMRIRKSTLSDFESILKIYDIARQFMVKQGNPNSGLKIIGHLKIWLGKI